MYNPCMPLFTSAERRLLSAVAKLAYSDPFLPERVENERAALGREFHATGEVWSASVTHPDAIRVNVVRIDRKLEPVVDSVRTRLVAADDIREDELAMYEDAV